MCGEEDGDSELGSDAALKSRSFALLPPRQDDNSVRGEEHSDVFCEHLPQERVSVVAGVDVRVERPPVVTFPDP
jgi:hypothetical protein